MFLIEETHLKTLKLISQRLFTEDRLNGDQMRDFAQSIDLIVRFAESLNDDDNRPWNEISEKDVGKHLVDVFGRSWVVSNFIGKIFPEDVGKRVYLVGDFLQVENEEQRKARLGKK